MNEDVRNTSKRHVEKYFYHKMKSAYYKLQNELDDFNDVKQEL